MKQLQNLLNQLSPDEQNGAILKVSVPKGTLKATRSPQAMLEETRAVIIADAISQALTSIRCQAGLRSKDIAQNLNISPARVTQIQTRANNLTLATLVQHAQAADCEVEIVLRPRNKNLPEVRTAL